MVFFTPPNSGLLKPGELKEGAFFTPLFFNHGGSGLLLSSSVFLNLLKALLASFSAGLFCSHGFLGAIAGDSMLNGGQCHRMFLKHFEPTGCFLQRAEKMILQVLVDWWMSRYQHSICFPVITKLSKCDVNDQCQKKRPNNAPSKSGFVITA